MLLSPTQTRIAQDWIDQYVGKHCPCCGYTSLHLDKKLVAVVEFPDKGKPVGSASAAPMLTLTCGVCANTRFFSATLVGILADRLTQLAPAAVEAGAL
jgi:predicted nucleic-acid-binding Zn-ribbon protein